MTTALNRGEPRDGDQDRNRQGGDHLDSQREDTQRGTRPAAAASRTEPAQTHRQPERPSRMRNFLVIIAVAVIGGTVGAMGNAYFFGKQAGDRSEAQKRSTGNSSAETTADQSAQTQANESSKQAPAGAPIPGIGSAQEVEELKQQIRNLNQRINGLNEKVDRLQDLLSLAVPLLQRLAPKS
jgi:hypothetical protein